MVKIVDLKARQVLDSRGNPTVEVDFHTKDGLFTSIVPSGASTGKHEALELRDKNNYFNGKSVWKAVNNVNTKIRRFIVGKEYESQKELDSALFELDSTPNKAELGANAILPVSMCYALASAAHKEIHLYESLSQEFGNESISLPVPQLNVLNGGKHAGMDNDIQEHMLMPVDFESFSEALRAGTETYHLLKKKLKEKFGPRATLLGDEGGFVPPVGAVEDRLELMNDAVDEAGYSGKIKFALDCASSEFFHNDHYIIGKKKFYSGELADYYSELAEKFSIVSIEDGMAEDDWEGWKELNSKLGNKIQLVGDDLLVTNSSRIEQALQEKACNSLLLKVNQIGSVTESIRAANLALKNGWSVVVSHRSGESEDTFIADLVVASGCGQSKFGAPARSERTAKYNRLLRIEELLGETAVFASDKFLR